MLVYLALGSNVGNSQDYIARATKLLGDQLSGLRSAPIYTSKPVGYTEQADFYNTVLEGETNLTPTELLDFTQSVEQRVGRIRRFRWGPREIDIDIILYGEKVVDEPDLHIPHQRFAERDFVLKPLLDLNPSLVDPRSHRSIQELYNELPDKAHSLR